MRRFATLAILLVTSGFGAFAQAQNARFDELYAQMQVTPDSPERLQLCDEAVRIIVAYMPYEYPVHRIYTDMAQPWLHGYRRPPFWLGWWAYIDIDAAEQAKAIR
jgi:ABC-type transport system substrate-binding protein